MKSDCCSEEINIFKKSRNEPTTCSKCGNICVMIPETLEEMMVRRRKKDCPEFVKADSFWKVVYECRYTIIHISPFCDGFFAFGQDALWGFSNVAEWIKEIDVYDK